VNLSGYGSLDPGNVIIVPDVLGKQLIGRPNFVEVKEKLKKTTPKKKIRKTKPTPLKTNSMASAVKSEFSVEGGDN